MLKAIQIKPAVLLQANKEMNKAVPFFHFAIALASTPPRMLFVGTFHRLHSKVRGSGDRKYKQLQKAVLALSLLMGGGSINF